MITIKNDCLNVFNFNKDIMPYIIEMIYNEIELIQFHIFDTFCPFRGDIVYINSTPFICKSVVGIDEDVCNVTLYKL